MSQSEDAAGLRRERDQLRGYLERLLVEVCMCSRDESRAQVDALLRGDFDTPKKSLGAWVPVMSGGLPGSRR